MVPDLAFDALADPVRREILTVLAARDECSAGELSGHIDRVGRTAVSSHLRVLRNAGLIAERRLGRFRYYSVDPTGPAQDVISLLQTLFRGALSTTDPIAPLGATAPVTPLSSTAPVAPLSATAPVVPIADDADRRAV